MVTIDMHNTYLYDNATLYYFKYILKYGTCAFKAVLRIILCIVHVIY